MSYTEQPCHCCGYEGWHDDDCVMYGTTWDYEIGAYL